MYKSGELCCLFLRFALIFSVLLPVRSLHSSLCFRQNCCNTNEYKGKTDWKSNDRFGLKQDLLDSLVSLALMWKGCLLACRQDGHIRSQGEAVSEGFQSLVFNAVEIEARNLQHRAQSACILLAPGNAHRAAFARQEVEVVVRVFHGQNLLAVGGA